MKKFALSAVLMFLIGCSADNAKNETVTLGSLSDSVGYAIGMDIGKTFSSREIEVNIDAFTAGFAAAYSGNETLLNDSIAFIVNRDYQASWQAKQQAKAQEVANVNKAAGDIFLRENAKKTDVTVLPSGLQYKVLNVGDGENPPAGSNVLVKYEGRLLDGTVFDSNYDSAEPIQLSLARVIKGWQEAIPRMRVGDEWELYIPSELAYGQRGSGGAIGPNETLIFKVKLEGLGQ